MPEGQAPVLSACMSQNSTQHCIRHYHRREFSFASICREYGSISTMGACHVTRDAAPAQYAPCTRFSRNNASIRSMCIGTHTLGAIALL